MLKNLNYIEPFSDKIVSNLKLHFYTFLSNIESKIILFLLKIDQYYTLHVVLNLQIKYDKVFAWH